MPAQVTRLSGEVEIEEPDTPLIARKQTLHPDRLQKNKSIKIEEQKKKEKNTQKYMLPPIELLQKLLTKEPRTRSKEDIRHLVSFLSNYFKQLLFSSDPAAKKYTEV